MKEEETFFKAYFNAFMPTKKNFKLIKSIMDAVDESWLRKKTWQGHTNFCSSNHHTFYPQDKPCLVSVSTSTSAKLDQGKKFLCLIYLFLNVTAQNVTSKTLKRLKHLKKTSFIFQIKVALFYFLNQLFMRLFNNRNETELYRPF